MAVLENQLSHSRSLSVEEYLALDNNSPERYEYHDGMVRAMSGGTQAHNTIITNMVAAVRSKAVAKKCRIYAEGMRFQVSGKQFFYPDFMVSCEDIAQHERVVLKPCFVVEVLSDSTFAYDFSRKLFNYMGNPHVQTIAYILQTERKVFGYQRGKDGWELQELTEGMLDIPCIDASLSLDDIYDLIDFNTIPSETVRGEINPK